MKPRNPHGTDEALELWIQHRFSLTGADEMHRSSFSNIFREYIGEIWRDFKIDPVTDHLALWDPEEPQTCRELVENGMEERFANYLLARNNQHGSAFAEVFARLSGIGVTAERATEAAYWELFQTPGTPPANLVWEDAHDTCLRLGQSEAYAKMCADNLLDLNPDFQLAKAHAITSKYFANLAIGEDRGYSEIRATMFAEYQGPIWISRPAPMAELFSRIVEEQMRYGRTKDGAQWYADHYVSCFDVDGSFDIKEEALWGSYATVRAEANCRFRPTLDGDRDGFVRLFESVAGKVLSRSEPATGTSFDEVERILRESYFLKERSEHSSRPCWVKTERD